MFEELPDWSSHYPLIIGIAGGSGSGKSAIADAVAAWDNSIQVIKHDAYYRHRDDLTYEERSRLNHDHPDSLESELLVSHLRALKRGQSIGMPQYDFKTHLRTVKTVTIEATPVLIVEGILVLAEDAICELLDLRIFVDTDADLRLLRRLRRDIDERGRTISSVLSQYEETVRPMHNEFVAPSKQRADVIIPGGYNPKAVGLVIELIRSQLAA